jgi:hypothetical protein
VTLDETIAEIYDGLGEAGRASMVRADLDPHAGCGSATENKTLGAILGEVPDATKSTKHNDDCWRRHAACLRDKIYNDLGWE